jgi:phosphoribosylanthranilate isomerase
MSAGGIEEAPRAAPRVKICGIRSFEDGLAALEAGADYLGFNFYSKSPRYLEPRACGRLLADLKAVGIPFVSVGILADAGAREIERALALSGVEEAQVCGPIAREEFEALGGRAFVAHRVADEDSLRAAFMRFPPRLSAPAFLLDACVPGSFGGTGRRVARGLAELAAGFGPYFLAGGLTPENVGQSVAELAPWGVDVASGVESSPGRKDADAVRRFVRNAKATSRARGRGEDA